MVTKNEIARKVEILVKKMKLKNGKFGKKRKFWSKNSFF